VFDKTTHPSPPSDSKSTYTPLSLPKFRIGDRVFWFRVSTQDFGVVSDRFYGLESSVKAEGWHYQIKLDPQSPSFPHCKEDYGFEDDLEYLR
jgi:hypothetical protein